MARSRSLRKSFVTVLHAYTDMCSNDMKEMFEFSLRRTYELLLRQMQQARRSGNVQLKVFLLLL